MRSTLVACRSATIGDACQSKKARTNDEHFTHFELIFSFIVLTIEVKTFKILSQSYDND